MAERLKRADVLPMIYLVRAASTAVGCLKVTERRILASAESGARMAALK